jgi:hypothetical protein
VDGGTTLPVATRLKKFTLGSSSVGTELLFSHGEQTGRRLALISKYWIDPTFELRSCGPVCRESLPYPGYGRSGARPSRWSRSPESLNEYSVPLLPNTQLVTKADLLKKYLISVQKRLSALWLKGTVHWRYCRFQNHHLSKIFNSGTITGPSHVRWLRPALATFRPGSSTR